MAWPSCWLGCGGQQGAEKRNKGQEQLTHTSLPRAIPPIPVQGSWERNDPSQHPLAELMCTLLGTHAGAAAGKSHLGFHGVSRGCGPAGRST